MYYLGLSPKPKAKPKAKPKKVDFHTALAEVQKKLGTKNYYPVASSDDTVIGNEWYHPAGGAATTKEVASAYAKELRARIGVPGSVRVRFLEDGHVMNGQVLNKNGKWTSKPVYMIFISEPVLFG